MFTKGTSNLSLLTYYIIYLCMDGSIIGAVIIALGLYAVVWGKAKDYSDPKLASVDAGETKTLPTTTTDDPKIDVVVVNLDKQPPVKQTLEEPNTNNTVEKETELCVTDI